MERGVREPAREGAGDVAAVDDPGRWWAEQRIL